MWDTNPVRAPGHRSKTFTHPEIGAVRINCDVLAVPDDDQQVVFMTADPGTPSARALRHLLHRAGHPDQEGHPSGTGQQSRDQQAGVAVPHARRPGTKAGRVAPGLRPRSGVS